MTGIGALTKVFDHDVVTATVHADTEIVHAAHPQLRV
jgi:hypothetical protein